MIIIDVLTKDLKDLRFMLPSSEQTAEAFWKGFQIFAFPDNPTLYFAYYYKPQYPEGTRNGWEIYNDMEEYKRMGISLAESSPFKLYTGNCSWALTATYPKRIIVPRSIPDRELEECSKFRTKERFPALTYFHKPTGASIWRSSQPKVLAEARVGRDLEEREQGGPEDGLLHRKLSAQGRSPAGAVLCPPESLHHHPHLRCPVQNRSYRE
eukprot:TRINITY_DN4376_c0_g1_i19.p1 TRINITY_DN4376_c0_g1~~TRINITY_DN4376_c0_g1_i19.p1  ORF type:complete len:210 (+),score=24.40 TRINITY_DN4376_c0_g1_i19:142-771(+)